MRLASLLFLALALYAADPPKTEPAKPLTIEQQLAEVKAENVALRARIEWDARQANVLNAAVQNCLGAQPQIPAIPAK